MKIAQTITGFFYNSEIKTPFTISTTTKKYSLASMFVKELKKMAESRFTHSTFYGFIKGDDLSPVTFAVGEGLNRLWQIIIQRAYKNRNYETNCYSDFSLSLFKYDLGLWPDYVARRC
ncbi:MAG: hypothetical protein DHS20C17_31170 [Cyclobacteriaceae bacterium]|nr:MAG: hypothetical protein DHS20C17_31170 [Cyclobacteriaceae bacterium]